MNNLNFIDGYRNNDVLEQQINQQFEQNILTVKQDDPYKTARIKTSESKKMRNLKH